MESNFEKKSFVQANTSKYIASTVVSVVSSTTEKQAAHGLVFVLICTKTFEYVHKQQKLPNNYILILSYAVYSGSLGSGQRNFLVHSPNEKLNGNN